MYSIEEDMYSVLTNSEIGECITQIDDGLYKWHYGTPWGRDYRFEYVYLYANERKVRFMYGKILNVFSLSDDTMQKIFNDVDTLSNSYNHANLVNGVISLPILIDYREKDAVTALDVQFSERQSAQEIFDEVNRIARFMHKTTFEEELLMATSGEVKYFYCDEESANNVHLACPPADTNEMMDTINEVLNNLYPQKE